MAIKKYNPTSPARRFMTVSDFAEITKKSPERSLLAKKDKHAGRNSYGRITVRHRGGGNRRKYRIIDFKRNKDGMPATVIGVEYDPNRSANIALIQYEDGEKAYIIAPIGLTDGDVVVSGEGADIKPGNALFIKDIPVGTLIHNNTTNCWSPTHVTLSSGFTDRYVFMLLVTYNTDSCFTIKSDHSNFAAWKSNLCIVAFLSHKLCTVTCTSYKLSALSRIQ